MAGPFYGHLLGIQDDYNMCGLGLDTAISHQFEQEIIVPGLVKSSEACEKLSNDFNSCFQSMFPWLIRNVVNGYIFLYMVLPYPNNHDPV